MRIRSLVFLSVLSIAATMLPMTSANAAPAASSFMTSFEEGQPQPGYTDEVEDGRTGGVEGPTPTGIGGSEMDKVTEIEANGENTGGGEVASNVGDGDKFTKWLVFEPTGWVQYTLSEPVTVKQLRADLGQRRPRSATRGTGPCRARTTAPTWTTVDTRTGETFSVRFQTKDLRLRERRGVPLLPAGHHRELRRHRSSSSPSWCCPTARRRRRRADMTERGSAPARPRPNANARVGFTGAEGVAVRRPPDRRGPWLLLEQGLDVDVPVTADTELSYKIFPEHSDRRTTCSLPRAPTPRSTCSSPTGPT